MQAFVALLIVAFVIGGSPRAAPVRKHPIILLAFTFVIAASLYSLRVVL